MANNLQIMVDLNVIIDVIQNRQPFYEESARVLDAVARQEVSGWLAAHSVTTLFYVVSRLRNRETAVATLTTLLDVFTIATVDDAVIRKAISWGWKDFEDAVQMAAAMNAGANFFVTRNARDFQSGLVPIISPAALIALLKQSA
ncbi:MAG: PIN domain-containing protein [Ardenticatenaceae bacterium]|nr:PIN domain-containing protein [Anaerolineales bacterium]MCB8921694.1 PIN domain-containing protein [Ardenticatenaceae bacterium]MCB8990787.1 PIN domain-containing protein [Ardenticatenaceae bacterium]MCB9003274.1 PIN domain-containing protein [Ardenticatenaceae bacterium]